MENSTQFKINRKRKRKTNSESSNSEEKIQSNTLSCKDRAKKHRERKKKYYQELEEKVERLEIELAEIKEKYKNSTKSQCGEGKCCEGCPRQELK